MSGRHPDLLPRLCLLRYSTFFSVFSSVRRPLAETDSKTDDLSVHGVRIADLITGGIFAVAMLYAVPECADGRALTGAADVYTFSLVSYEFIVDKDI